MLSDSESLFFVRAEFFFFLYLLAGREREREREPKSKTHKGILRLTD